MNSHERAQLLKKLTDVKTKIDDAIRRAAIAEDDKDRKLLQRIVKELRSLQAQRLALEAEYDDSAQEPS